MACQMFPALNSIQIEHLFIVQYFEAPAEEVIAAFFTDAINRDMVVGLTKDHILITGCSFGEVFEMVQNFYFNYRTIITELEGLTSKTNN